MSVMLGNMAVTEVVKFLNDAELPLLESNTSCGCKPRIAYKYEKPDKLEGEYIAVNHLPFVHRKAVCEGVVNINIHVPKLKSGEPDTKRLDELSDAIANLFPEGTYLGKAFYEFLSDSRPTPDNDDTYFVNLQLNVIFNNLNN